MKKRIADAFKHAVKSAYDAGELKSESVPGFQVEIPKHKDHGDFAVNIAMLMAKGEKASPRIIAEKIINHLDKGACDIKIMEIAGPGFINIFLKDSSWFAILDEISVKGECFGKSDIGKGQRIQVEFVSANPTGPLHIGHGRGAAFGDALSSVLRAAGYEVETEYYINDAGNQMDKLGESLFVRYLQISGKDITFPDNGYKGDYLIKIAEDFKKIHGDRYVDEPIDKVNEIFIEFASESILNSIKDDLKQFGVKHDLWFSEKTLFDNNLVDKTLNDLENKGFIYNKDGAKWFKSSKFGDEKDRVVIRDNGLTTYFASDIAYHDNKFKRGYDRIINLWGADHHGYVQRLKGAVSALGIDADKRFSVILVQFVSLIKDGEPVAMSTRAAQFETLKDVVDEVGKDAARFSFLLRRADSPLDFDMDLVKARTIDNPVFYVQYAHARICSIFETAMENNIDISHWKDIDPTLLTTEDEVSIIKLLASFPEVIAKSAQFLEPHRITYYLGELASKFHGYYNRHRVITEDIPLSRARLYLINAIRHVLKNGLTILGVSAPGKM